MITKVQLLHFQALSGLGKAWEKIRRGLLFAELLLISSLRRGAGMFLSPVFLISRGDFKCKEQ